MSPERSSWWRMWVLGYQIGTWNLSHHLPPVWPWKVQSYPDFSVSLLKNGYAKGSGCPETPVEFSFIFFPGFLYQDRILIPFWRPSCTNNLLLTCTCSTSEHSWCIREGSWMADIEFVTQISTAALHLSHQPSLGDISVSGHLRFPLQQEGPCWVCRGSWCAGQPSLTQVLPGTPQHSEAGHGAALSVWSPQTSWHESWRKLGSPCPTLLRGPQPLTSCSRHAQEHYVSSRPSLCSSGNWS